MLHEVMQVLAFANDTLLMRNVPCPDIWTPSDTSNRRKLSSNQYQFPFRPGSITGCAGEPGDLFVVRPLPIVPILAGRWPSCDVMWTPSDTSKRGNLFSDRYLFPFRPSSITGCACMPGDLFGVCAPIVSALGPLCPVLPFCSAILFKCLP